MGYNTGLCQWQQTLSLYLFKDPWQFLTSKCSLGSSKFHLWSRKHSIELHCLPVKKTLPSLYLHIGSLGLKLFWLSLLMGLQCPVLLHYSTLRTCMRHKTVSDLCFLRMRWDLHRLSNRTRIIKEKGLHSVQPLYNPYTIKNRYIKNMPTI